MKNSYIELYSTVHLYGKFKYLRIKIMKISYIELYIYIELYSTVKHYGKLRCWDLKQWKLAI